MSFNALRWYFCSTYFRNPGKCSVNLSNTHIGDSNKNQTISSIINNHNKCSPWPKFVHGHAALYCSFPLERRTANYCLNIKQSHTHSLCRMHFEGQIQWADKQSPSSDCGTNLHKLKNTELVPDTYNAFRWYIIRNLSYDSNNWPKLLY